LFYLQDKYFVVVPCIIIAFGPGLHPSTHRGHPDRLSTRILTASARNVIEHIFGVLKRRYRVLQLPLEYSLEIQSRLPASLAAVHNFILIHTPVDGNAPDNTDEVEVGGDEHLYQGGDPFAAGDGEENHANVGVEAGVMRDDMAQRMWDDYQAILLGREDLGDSDSSDILDGIDALHL